MSAILQLKWLRIKYGSQFHARIGRRRTFVCGKAFSGRYRIIGAPDREFLYCDKCRAAIELVEDMYAGATD